MFTDGDVLERVWSIYNNFIFLHTHTQTHTESSCFIKLATLWPLLSHCSLQELAACLTQSPDSVKHPITQFFAPGLSVGWTPGLVEGWNCTSALLHQNISTSLLRSAWFLSGKMVTTANIHIFYLRNVIKWGRMAAPEESLVGVKVEAFRSLP